MKYTPSRTRFEGETRRDDFWYSRAETKRLKPKAVEKTYPSELSEWGVHQRGEQDGGVEHPGHRVPAAIAGPVRSQGDPEGRPDQDGAERACGL